MDAQNKRSNRTPSRCVFIGNIAYDASKEKLKQIFSEVGPIVNFRMVYDRESGKPKGYAFCEYMDEASAMSAMRNLNDRDLNGRKLRVDFADNNKINMPGDNDFDADDMPPSISSSGGGGGGGSSGVGNIGGSMIGGPNVNNPVNNPMSAGGVGGATGGIGSIGGANAGPSTAPMGMRMAPQQQADAIMTILQKLPKNQLYDAVSQMKHIVTTNPEKARQIFAQNPTLAIVMLDIQYILGMLKQPFAPQMAPPSLIPTGGPPSVGDRATPPFHHGSVPMTGPPPAMGMATGPHPGMGMAPAPAPIGVPPRGPHMGPGPMGIPQGPPHGMVPPMGMPHNAPPRMASPHQNPYSAFPPVNQPPMAPANPAQAQLQEALKDIKPEELQQLLALTPQQLEALPEDTRQQVLFIQKAFGGK